MYKNGTQYKKNPAMVDVADITWSGVAECGKIAGHKHKIETISSKRVSST